MPSGESVACYRRSSPLFIFAAKNCYSFHFPPPALLHSISCVSLSSAVPVQHCSAHPKTAHCTCIVQPIFPSAALLTFPAYVLRRKSASLFQKPAPALAVTLSSAALQCSSTSKRYCVALKCSTENCALHPAHCSAVQCSAVQPLLRRAVQRTPCRLNVQTTCLHFPKVFKGASLCMPYLYNYVN